jgi:hypothetical protein
VTRSGETGTTLMRAIVLAGVVGALALVGCSSDGGDPVATTVAGTSGDSTVSPLDGDASGTTTMARDLRRAVEAVEAELGGPQEFFEVTATSQLTNVFVAIDDATKAVPYVFVGGELEVPGPTLEGAEGHTFVSSAMTFDDELLLSVIAEQLPTATIDAVSAEGGPDGTVRYVVSARSDEGGLLDIVVGPNGAIQSVQPI